MTKTTKHRSQSLRIQLIGAKVCNTGRNKIHQTMVCLKATKKRCINQTYAWVANWYSSIWTSCLAMDQPLTVERAADEWPRIFSCLCLTKSILWSLQHAWSKQQGKCALRPPDSIIWDSKSSLMSGSMTWSGHNGSLSTWQIKSFYTGSCRREWMVSLKVRTVVGLALSL